MKSNKVHFQRSMLVFIIAFLAFNIPVQLYKLANFHFNQNYVFTDRGAWALYGQTAKRMEPLTWKRFLGAVAYIPSGSFCNWVLDEETCNQWGYGPSDNFGVKMREKVAKDDPNLSLRGRNKVLINRSIQKAMENPFQYGMLWTFEGLKMFFWESCSMAYVVLPEIVANVYRFQPLNKGVFFLMPLICLISILFLMICVCRGIKNYIINLNYNNEYFIILSILTFVISYVSIHAFFFTFGRYYIPIACLYLIGIGFLIQKGLNFKKG